MKRFSVPRCLLALAVLAAEAAATEPQEVQTPEPELAPLTNLAWRLPAKYATLEGDRLVVDIPADAYPASAMATAELPLALLEWDGATLELASGSQGAWQALHAAARVPGITKITIGSPWGCDWTGQTAFGRLNATYRPKCWFPDMAYFDPVFAARRIRCPVEITRAGLGDSVCAPSSFAVLYNELRVPKKITWNQGWTHGWSPAGMASWTVDDGFDAAASATHPPAAFDSGALANP